MPGFFNTGGDLQLFQEKIRARDRQALTDYADACVVAIHGLMTGFGTSTITLSMVEGAALGGGLECALAHQFALAQSDARMGFPEIAFNLFPGMGAYSTVYRRAGQTLAEELLLGGSMRSGDWYHEKGLVYQVFAPSQGIRAVRTLVDTFIPKLNGIRGTLAARQRVAGISLEELLDVTHAWVERALSLEQKDLAYMARLVNAQSKVSRATVLV
jgi:DSF synthase